MYCALCGCRLWQQCLLPESKGKSVRKKKCKANTQKQILRSLVLSCSSQLSLRGHLCFLKRSSEQSKAVSYLFLREDYVGFASITKTQEKEISNSLLFSDDFTATPRYYANVRHILCNYKRTLLRKMRRVASLGLIIQSWLLSHFSQSRRGAGDPEWMALPQSKPRLTWTSISLWAGK